MFILMWPIADDEGRLPGNPRYLAHQLFPYDSDVEVKVTRWIRELEGQGCIVTYTVDSNSFIQISNWKKHQKIDHPRPSRIPSPTALGQTQLALDMPPERIDGAPDQSRSRH